MTSDQESLQRAARTIRLVLTVGAAIFAVTGLLLLLLPANLGSLLGLATDAPATQWVLRMLGVVLLPLAAFMILVRRLRDYHAIGAAMVMAVASLLMTIMTLTLPGSWTFLRTAFLGIGLVFAGAYATLLVILRRASAF